MARMIDLIRESAVPANLMRSAARGALSLPPAEILEILVLLAEHPLFGEQAQLTLAGWDAAAAWRVVSDPQAPPTVLDYLSRPANLRVQLLPALLDNPAIPEARLLELAQAASPAQLPVFAASDRIPSCPAVVGELLARAELTAADRDRLQPVPAPDAPDMPPADAAGEASTGAEESPDVLEPQLSQFLLAHADEIQAEEGKPFQLVDPDPDERALLASLAEEPAHKGVSLAGAAARAMSLALAAEPQRDSSRDRLTPVQKIAHMNVGERVQLAYRGSRDERFILIRDSARVVSAAVLESPKLTDSEVETFAALKNAAEHVLRIVASKRRFKRNYALKRILTSNPRCPNEVALPLIKELLVADLKKLTINKNVSDTVRNFALKIWRDKSNTRR
jgi:hypothetical protein